jgi:hypothetical protein
MPNNYLDDYFGMGGGGVPVPPPVPTVPTPTVPTTPAIDPRQQALAIARLQFQQELQRRGMDPSSYGGELDSYLSNISNTVQGDNLSQYLPATLASDILSGVQNRQRNAFRGQVNQNFGQNSGIDALPDTFLDNTINEILNTQFGNAQSTLDRGRARGQFNDRGYQAGLGTLNSQRQAAQARLNTTEGDILSGYRSRLGDVRSNAFNSANNFELGGQFDIGEFLRQRDTITGEANQNAAGELISSVGSTPLFDFGTIGNSAGQAQGAVNLNNLDVRESLAARRARQTQGRGLGSQGAF